VHILKAIDYEEALWPWAPPWTDRGVQYGPGSVRAALERERGENRLFKAASRGWIEDSRDELLLFSQRGPSTDIDEHLKRICRLLLQGVRARAMAVELGYVAQGKRDKEAVKRASEWIKVAREEARLFAGGATYSAESQ
jgi:hypothetical protein